MSIDKGKKVLRRGMSATRHRLFISVTPGLEELLEGELTRLGYAAFERAEGGVELATDSRALWRICRESALAEGVRLRVGRSALTRTFDELQSYIARLPLHAFLRRGGALPRIRVTCKKSRLYHSDAVAERVEQVLRQRLSCGEAASSGQILHVRLEQDRVQLSVDAAGEPLHRRGYRTHVGEAPLRETLAAALLQAAGYRGERALWDPFCGSGTIAIEAMARARSVAPGAARSFAFEGWPTHDAQAYAALCEESKAGDAQAEDRSDGPTSRPRVIGSDRDAKVLGAARENAARAGLAHAIEWRRGSFDRVEREVGRGVAMISNPPYGQRLDGPDLERTYTRLGQMLRRRRDIAPVVLLDGSKGLLAKTRLPWRVLWRFENRGLPVRVVELVREEGSKSGKEGNN